MSTYHTVTLADDSSAAQFSAPVPLSIFGNNSVINTGITAKAGTTTFKVQVTLNQWGPSTTADDVTWFDEYTYTTNGELHVITAPASALRFATNGNDSTGTATFFVIQGAAR